MPDRSGRSTVPDEGILLDMDTMDDYRVICDKFRERLQVGPRTVSLFLLAFFLIYGVHASLCLRPREAGHRLFQVGRHAVALVMAVMILTPLLIRLSERAGFGLAAHHGSCRIYLDRHHLLLVCTLLLTDLRRVIPSLAGKPPDPSERVDLLSPLASISLTASLYGYFEALNIRNDHITIASPKIPREHGRDRWSCRSRMSISASIVWRSGCKRILKVVRKAEPDMLVATGDIVDGQMDGLSHFLRTLTDLRPRYGKYAITGIYEF
ncbi:MAG: hypothetical protein MZV70_00655 [Desulfobacterales bacterium]|nr:hypothetical protein [Desulfobacterales bacterium]